VNCVGEAVHGASEPFTSDVKRSAADDDDDRSVGDTVSDAAATTATMMTSPVGVANMESRQSIDTVPGEGCRVQ